MPCRVVCCCLIGNNYFLDASGPGFGSLRRQVVAKKSFLKPIINQEKYHNKSQWKKQLETAGFRFSPLVAELFCLDCHDSQRQMHQANQPIDICPLSTGLILAPPELKVSLLGHPCFLSDSSRGRYSSREGSSSSWSSRIVHVDKLGLLERTARSVESQQGYYDPCRAFLTSFLILQQFKVLS